MKETVKQAGKFGIVGVSNTVIDLAVYNLLIFGFGMYEVSASVISVSLAIINSYIWNKRWTFQDRSRDDIPVEFIKFVSFSLVGLGIQAAVIWLLADKWLASGEFAYSIVDFIGLDAIFSSEFVIANWAKAWGIGLALIWNFVAYKNWTFKSTKK
ncbi:MAG: GtrA family protein [Patescibacteria group bacterium]|nr:GtrA family protein [Patescibacteria group bacterium]